MKFEEPRIFYYLAGLLFLLNCIQAFFTELIYDEAYYWHYAQDLSWGYFDHPPMVAVLIKLSGFLNSGELGVRFMSCLFSVATIFILWRCIDNPEKRKYIPHFYLLVFSMTLLNAYGFFTLPDTPLLFFTALFLWCYKNFLEKNSIFWSVFLGVSMSLMMYSKYHAALIIIFIFLSNISLVKNKWAWLAVIVGIVCFSPHLLWLYDNQFVTIKYHLFERPNRAYEFTDFSLGFLVNLVILFGLTFPWIYKSLFKTKAQDLFTKSLLYLVYGFILFFFISSFNRRIQTQWLITICIPLVIIVYNYMLKDESTFRWILRAGIANIVLLMYLRIGLAYAPFFPVHYESHGNREWAERIVAEVGEMPVVFENSYRRAPMYEFYSGNESFSLNNIWYRQNQYSIDNSENAVQHKDVLLASKFLKRSDFDIELQSGSTLKSVYIPNFESFRKLRCAVDRQARTENPEEWIFTLYNPYKTAIELSKLKFGIAFLNKHKQVREQQQLQVRLLEENIKSIKPTDTLRFAFSIPESRKAQPAYFRICISENNLPYGLNGNAIKLPR